VAVAARERRERRNFLGSANAGTLVVRVNCRPWTGLLQRFSLAGTGAATRTAGVAARVARGR